MVSLKKRHIYLIIMLVLIGVFHALAGVRPVMNAVAGGTLVLRQALGKAAALFPFSLAEALCCLGILLLLAWLVWTIVSVCRAPGRMKRERSSSPPGNVTSPTRTPSMNTCARVANPVKFSRVRRPAALFSRMNERLYHHSS